MKTVLINLKEFVKMKSRKKKIEHFYSMCRNECTVLDVGVGPENDGIHPEISANHFLREFKFNPIYYTGLGIEGMDKMKSKYPEYKFVEYDGNIFPFNNKEFE